MAAASLANQVLFYFFAALAVISGVLMVTRRNIVHSAVFLITTLLASAGLYLQLQAEFLFAVQVILYVGGIMVLFVFVIMLVNLDLSIRQSPFNRQKWVAGLLSGVLALEFLAAFLKGGNVGSLPLPPPSVVAGNTERVGEAIFQTYMLPFEIASILLLVAMIGAVIMAKRRI